jgi:L-ascorbate metabolism protein UlaG (beta-lactamase superfamily)
MSENTITRIAHSCHLIEIGGKKILTDPWFSEKAFYHPGEIVAMTVADLPQLDAVLISHDHYDHCDMQAFADYPDKTVPLFVAEPVAVAAKKAGFSTIKILQPWESVQLDAITITATPAKHGVPEIGFVIQDETQSIYFAGDSLFIPELRQLPDHFGHLNAALLPTNGLQIRPFNKQVVMNAQQAAELTAILKPDLAMPQHYAFTGGWLGDLFFTKSDPDPQHFADAVQRLAPETTVKIVEPGTTVRL